MLGYNMYVYEIAIKLHISWEKFVSQFFIFPRVWIATNMKKKKAYEVQYHAFNEGFVDKFSFRTVFYAKWAYSKDSSND